MRTTNPTTSVKRGSLIQTRSGHGSFFIGKELEKNFQWI